MVMPMPRVPVPTPAPQPPPVAPGPEMMGDLRVVRDAQGNILHFLDSQGRQVTRAATLQRPTPPEGGPQDLESIGLTTGAAGGPQTLGFYDFIAQQRGLKDRTEGLTYYNEQGAASQSRWDTSYENYLASKGVSGEFGVGGEGAAGPSMGPMDWYTVFLDEAAAKRLQALDLIDIGKLNAEQAQAKFDNWATNRLVELRGSEEAGRRGEAVGKTLETRARRTLPTEFFPGTEKGGAVSRTLAHVGIGGDMPLPGVPVSQMPDPWAAYTQAEKSIPQGAPAPAVPLQQFQAPPPEAYPTGLMERLRGFLGGAV